jgi:hypothetical protein
VYNIFVEKGKILVKLQSKVSGTYTTESVSVPKQFLDKIVKKYGKEPIMFEVKLDKKNRLIYEPKFLE